MVKDASFSPRYDNEESLNKSVYPIDSDALMAEIHALLESSEPLTFEQKEFLDGVSTQKMWEAIKTF